MQFRFALFAFAATAAQAFAAPEVVPRNTGITTKFDSVPVDKAVVAGGAVAEGDVIVDACYVCSSPCSSIYCCNGEQCAYISGFGCACLV